MTSIDQTLLAPAPAKTGKATGKAGDDKGSNSRDAFEGVFAKAAKKQDERLTGLSKPVLENEASDKKTEFSDLKMPGQAKLAGRRMGLPVERDDQVRSDMPIDTSVDVPAETAETIVSVRSAGNFNDSRIFDKKIKPKDEARDDTARTVKADAPADAAALAADVSNLMELLSAASQTASIKTEAAAAGSVTERSVLAEFHEVSSQMSKADQKREAGAANRTSTAANSDLVSETESNAKENDEIFRFARADGKGKALEMKLSALSDEARVADRDAPKAKVENVTVLESRRYLGLAANSNSNAGILTAAISGDKQWAAAMLPGSALANASLADNTGKVVNTLKLQMHPIDLGSVTATLRLTGDALNVDLRVETGEAYRQLNDDQNGILKALRAQGFAVDQITVSLVQPDASTQAGQSVDGNTQQQFNQPARDGAGNGTQQGRGQQDDDRQFTAGKGRGSKDEGTDEAIVAASTQRVSPGHVYL